MVESIFFYKYRAARQAYHREFVERWAENLRALGSRIEPIQRLTMEAFLNDDPSQLEDKTYEVFRLITDDYELECSAAGIAALDLCYAATELVERSQEKNQ